MVSKDKNFRETGLWSEQRTLTDASLDLLLEGLPAVLADALPSSPETTGRQDKCTASLPLV